jgi:ATPase subunit of ABC transporter with duplicated ATPase domains
VITTSNLTKQYADRTLFAEANIKIGNRVKVGLVGRNGCGKSTLLKIIAGEEDPTTGSIEMQNEVVAYIPQEFSFPNELVGEYLEKLLSSHWEFYKIESLANRLQFHNFDPYQSLYTLSEGQKMKIKLIEALLKNPTTLLIDEPTNHLDIEGIMWFEEYVQSLPASVVMISHDRQFLNNTVDEIWEIENGKIFRFVGNYDTYRSEKLKLIEKWDEEYILFLKHKDKLERLLASARAIKGDARGRAVKAAKTRIKREVEAREVTKYETKKVKDINFASDAHAQKLMVRVANVSKYYDAKRVFEDLDFELRGKEKIWLFGPNGAGKSTLVKMIMNIETPTSGEIKVGDNVRVGYFSQTQSQLNMDARLMDEFVEKTRKFEGEAIGYLRKYLFDKDFHNKKIHQLSPGERARLAFAIFAVNNYDVLILDEPDNHLDIETKEVLEKSLRDFKGALLLVSHDRYFVEMCGVSQLVNLKDGILQYIV